MEVLMAVPLSPIGYTPPASFKNLGAHKSDPYEPEHLPLVYPSAVKGGEKEAEKSGGGGEGEKGGRGKRKFTGSSPAETEEEELHSGTKSLISVALLLLVQYCATY